jgi:hypothetical protein
MKQFYTTNAFEDAKSLTLSLTVSLILAPALFTTPVKNEPNDFAPAVILLVTANEEKEKNEQLKNGSDNESAPAQPLHIHEIPAKKRVFYNSRGTTYRTCTTYNRTHA